MNVVRLLLSPKVFLFGFVVGTTQITFAQQRLVFCPSATLTDARVAAASTFDLRKIRQYTQLSSNFNVTSGTAFDYVALVTHRGNWEFCPESTIEGYEAALDAGVEAVEVDLRLSAPGFNPSEGTNYPNGEMFLSHDISLRGEAPDLDNNQPQNVLYAATPVEMVGRPMVDRAGNPAYVDSGSTPVLFHSLTDLLSHIVAKARKNNATVAPGSGNQGKDLLVRGAELVLDIKGDERELQAGFDNTLPNVVCSTNPSVKYCNSDQLTELRETMAEVVAFENKNNIDITQMIVYKFIHTKVKSSDWMNLVQTYYGQSPNVPGIALIAYKNTTTSTPVQIYPPSADDNKGFQSYSGYLLTNWNIQYDSVPGWQWNQDDLLGTSPATGVHATETFQSVNGFPEGIRQSAGECCRNPQGVLTHGQSGIEFNYQPKSSPLRPFTGWNYNIISTSATLDAYENANRYLINRGLRNLSRIK